MSCKPELKASSSRVPAPPHNRNMVAEMDSLCLESKTMGGYMAVSLLVHPPVVI